MTPSPRALRGVAPLALTIAIGTAALAASACVPDLVPKNEAATTSGSIESSSAGTGGATATTSGQGGATTTSSGGDATSTTASGNGGGSASSNAATSGGETTSSNSASSATATGSGSAGSGGGSPKSVLLSKNKVASQSSHHPSVGTPGGCCDGVYAGDSSPMMGGPDAVCITNYEASPWWKVDLGAVYTLTEVRVWRRSYCCPENATNFVIETSNDQVNWSLFASEPAAAASPTKYESSASARFVRIRLVNTGKPRPLNLNEVEIDGY